MSKKTKKLFLTLNIGPKAEEAKFDFKRFIGIGAVTVTALNPTKEELEKMYEREYQEKDYTIETPNGKAFGLEFHVKTDPEWESTGVATTGRVRFLISDRIRVNKDNTKCQIIDNYGETAWVTREQFSAKQKPDNCRIIGEYRACHEGEADLIMFLKEWLNVPLSTSWNRDMHTWVPVSDDELEKCQIVLNWDELVKGNIDDLRQIVQQCQEYRLFVCFGIRTTEDNHRYSDICNKVFGRFSSYNPNYFEQRINSLKSSGMYVNTQFVFNPIREWTIESTKFTQNIPTVPDTPTVDPAAFTGNNDLPF